MGHGLDESHWKAPLTRQRSQHPKAQVHRVLGDAILVEDVEDTADISNCFCRLPPMGFRRCGLDRADHDDILAVRVRPIPKGRPGASCVAARRERYPILHRARATANPAGARSTSLFVIGKSMPSSAATTYAPSNMQQSKGAARRKRKVTLARNACGHRCKQCRAKIRSACYASCFMAGDTSKHAYEYMAHLIFSSCALTCRVFLSSKLFDLRPDNFRESPTLLGFARKSAFEGQHNGEHDFRPLAPAPHEKCVGPAQELGLEGAPAEHHRDVLEDPLLPAAVRRPSRKVHVWPPTPGAPGAAPPNPATRKGQEGDASAHKRRGALKGREEGSPSTAALRRTTDNVCKEDSGHRGRTHVPRMRRPTSAE